MHTISPQAKISPHLGLQTSVQFLTITLVTSIQLAEAPPRIVATWRHEKRLSVFYWEERDFTSLHAFSHPFWHDIINGLVGFSIHNLLPPILPIPMVRPTQGCQRLGRVSVLLNPSNNSQRKIQTIVVVFPWPFVTRSSTSTWNSCSHLDSRPCGSLTPLNQVRPETCTRSSQ